MAQKIVDISKYINNDAPQMVLFGKTYTVKNDKKTVLLLDDLQRKSQAEGENADRFKLLITKNNVSIADVAEAESIRVVNNNRTISIYGGNDVRTEVYNALGQKVYETSDRVFDLNNVASGAYILKVSDGKTVNSTKIVVE